MSIGSALAFCTGLRVAFGAALGTAVSNISSGIIFVPSFGSGIGFSDAIILVSRKETDRA